MKILKFKETICKEDNLILLHKNCENCGSPLKLNKETMTCKCDYCDTEYYVKGTIENYSVVGQLIKITIRGEEKRFYIAEENFHRLYGDSSRNAKGELVSNLIAIKEILKLIEI